MSFNFSNISKDLKILSDRVSNEFNKEILPMAQRTSRKVQERMGRVNYEEISQLPTEYTELAAKCNNIEKLYKNVLKVTSVYESESYDYPSNLQESFNEFGKNIGRRMSTLSKATTPAEAQAALISSHSDPSKLPKTLYHALSRATDGSVLTSSQTDDDPLVRGLDLYSSTVKKVGNARIGQDQLIRDRFNKPLNTTLRQLISQSNRAQKKVEEKRIDYDLARSNLSTCSNAEKEPNLRVIMENAEDDFANTVEDAINIFQNVLEHSKPLQEFHELAKAQLAYHKLATEMFEGMVTDLEKIMDESESSSDKLSTTRKSDDFEI